MDDYYDKNSKSKTQVYIKRYAKAVGKNNSKNDGQLKFKVDDIIRLVKYKEIDTKEIQTWIGIDKNGNRGEFDSNLVEVLSGTEELISGQLFEQHGLDDNEFLECSKSTTKDSIQKIKLKKDEIRCVICLDKVRTILFQPCNHLVCCTKCSKIVNSKCPICRKEITSSLRVYM